MRQALLLVVMGALIAFGCSQRREYEATQSSSAGGNAGDPDDVHIEGDRITIDQRIHFEHDAATIMSDSNTILEHLATLLNNHTSDIVGLRVIGHTDDSGDHDYNQDLSERRAAAVVTALQERGVTQRMESSGVGETQPVCSEDTEDCHAANRRVEFVIFNE